MAGHQESGRGRLGRTWVELPRSSLLVSVLLRPDLPADRSPVITLAAGLASARAVTEACGLSDAGCKWPNDVVVGSRKLAGILTEGAAEGARLAHVVVGMGVNLTQRRQDFPDDLADLATSVALEGGRPDGAALLVAFLVELGRAVAAVASDPSPLLEAYAARCATIGRRVHGVSLEGDPVTGQAAGLGESGELLVRTPDGLRRIGSGEVRHLD